MENIQHLIQIIKNNKCKNETCSEEKNKLIKLVDELNKKYIREQLDYKSCGFYYEIYIGDNYELKYRPEFFERCRF